MPGDRVKYLINGKKNRIGVLAPSFFKNFLKNTNISQNLIKKLKITQKVLGRIKGQATSMVLNTYLWRGMNLVLKFHGGGLWILGTTFETFKMMVRERPRSINVSLCYEYEIHIVYWWNVRVE